jgi:hypothetical protein
VKTDQGPEPFLRIGNIPYRSQNALLGKIHGVIHDFEQDFVFALKMVIQATLAEFQGSRDVVHGSGVISPLLKQAGGRAQYLLPGIDHSFTGHRDTW